MQKANPPGNESDSPQGPTAQDKYEDPWKFSYVEGLLDNNPPKFFGLILTLRPWSIEFLITKAAIMRRSFLIII